MSIRGQDTRKPVVLFLAGGPGGTQLGTARLALGGLEDHFVVVNWEQPGAGKSFDEIVWFEHSGHTPWGSESERFVQAMVETVSN